MQGKLEQTGRDSYVQFKWGEYIYLKKDTYQTCAPHITQASHISWHWWEWWQRFQKILHLSWNRFYLTKGISTSWLGCRLLLRKFNRSCRKDKERCCNKDHYKITKIKSHFLSDGENKKRLIALLLQTIKKMSNWMLWKHHRWSSAWTGMCISEVNRVFSISSNA